MPLGSKSNLTRPGACQCPRSKAPSRARRYIALEWWLPTAWAPGALAMSLLLVLLSCATCCGFVYGLDEATLERNARELDQELQGLTAAGGPQHMVDADRAHSLHAKLAATLHMLNTMRPDGGSRVDRAVEAYTSAMWWAGQLQDNLSSVQHMSNLGAFLLEAGRPEQALEWIDATLKQADASSAAPELAAFKKVAFNQGKALSELGRLEEAESAYLGAVQQAYGRELVTFAKATAAMQSLPDQTLAQVLTTLDALEHTIMQAADLEDNPHDPRDPHDPHGSNSTTCPAPSLAPPARPPAARMTLLPTNPKLRPLWLLLKGSEAGERRRTGAGRGRARRRWGGEDDWLDKPQGESISWLCFAAYKALDKRGLYDPAWRALELGNTLMAAQAAYDVKPDMTALDIITKVFTGPFPHLGPGHQDPSPIFIVGAPRSGSTLLESLLAARTDVIPAGEDTLLAPLTEHIKAELMAMGPDTPKKLEELGRRYVEGMCKKFVPEDRDCSQVRVVDKNLRNMWTVAYIHLILPRACIIHVARHPLDTGLSCYAQPFHSPFLSWSWDLNHTASYLNNTWALAEHWHKTLPGSVTSVLYEELVTHPEAVLRRVTDACGMTWQGGWGRRST